MIWLILQSDNAWLSTIECCIYIIYTFLLIHIYMEKSWLIYIYIYISVFSFSNLILFLHKCEIQVSEWLIMTKNNCVWRSRFIDYFTRRHFLSIFCRTFCWNFFFLQIYKLELVKSILNWKGQLNCLLMKIY